MSRVDKILKEKDVEEKKSRVYIGVLVGLIIATVIFFGVYFLILSPAVDVYIADKPISHLYDFYDLNIGDNETAIYFLGNSQTGADVYIPLIQKQIDESGNKTLRVYNIYRDSDNPVRRLPQIENIIDSHPSLIIYGLSPWVFSTNSSGWVDEDVLLVKDSLRLNSTADYLYSEEELADLYQNTPNPFYMKRFLKGAVTETLPKLLSGTYEKMDPVTYTTNKTWTPWVNDENRKRYSNTFGKNGADLRNYIQITEDRLINERNRISTLPFTGEKNRKLQAFEYILNRFAEENIPVVLVIMPDHSLLNEYTPAESEPNFRKYIESLGLPWYDLDSQYDDTIMADLTHVNWDGAVKLAPVWADIVIKEMT